MILPHVYQPVPEQPGYLRAICFSSPPVPADTMKVWLAAVLSWLNAVPFLLHPASGESVDCYWGHYGNWSECDGCTKTQTRARSVQVFAQFGGVPCSGAKIEKRGCVPTKGCPLDIGCGKRFPCSSGQCISTELVCDGDQDCQDGVDEQNCEEESNSTRVCDDHRAPPNIELTGKGFDLLTGELRSGVLNTKSFGGQCRKVFSGDHGTFYRLPQSMLGYSFQVSVENDFSNELYNSSWSYMKHTEGHRYHIFHNELTSDMAHRLLIIRNEVEVAQFQNNAPEYLPLSEEFWKALSALPNAYEVSAYRSLIQTYGTHFLSEGSLGGRYQVLLQFDAEPMNKTSSSDSDYHRCVTELKRRLFRNETLSKCEDLIQNLKSAKGVNGTRIPVKTGILGGHPDYIAGLRFMDLEDPGANSGMYSKWAESVEDFPQVIKQKVRPLYELVKEVSCAAVKKLHLRRAVEEYLEEEHPCNCRACQNNGHALLMGTSCSCICQPDTSGPSCQDGIVPEGQPGAIHGDWSCWSTWSSCVSGQRSRTRICTNPAPRLGGRHCIGEPMDHQSCDDQDLQNLQTMEPHCFESSLTPAKACRTPPRLRNGFVMNPKDIYPIGSKIVYSCTKGHYIIGDPEAECTEQQTWRRRAAECKRIVCEAPPLPPHVTGIPWTPTYQIGDRVLLSCPPGMQRKGVSEITCDTSLNWSPSVGDTRCQAVSTQVPDPSNLQCRPWERLVMDRCVCVMPYECRSSLEVCATDSERGRTGRQSVCKLKALECLGHSFTLAEYSACDWPKHKATPCPACQLWETCDERSSVCVCREAAECSEPGTPLCVRPGEGTIAVTMTECEAGVRRCKGNPISIVSLTPCSS